MFSAWFCQTHRVLTRSAIPRKFIVAALLFVLSGGVPSLARAASIDPVPDSPGRIQPDRHTQDHSCCPRAHAPLVVPIGVGLLPDSIPCREHPCCISHGPDVPPILLTASGMRQPGVRRAFGEDSPAGFGSQLCPARDSFFNDAFQPYSSSSMILRI